MHIILQVQYALHQIFISLLSSERIHNGKVLFAANTCGESVGSEINISNQWYRDAKLTYLLIICKHRSSYNSQVLRCLRANPL